MYSSQITFTDDINNHIDNVIIPSKVSHSSQLVGQINRNEKSEQYTFPLNDDVGKDFKTVVDRDNKFTQRQN